MKKTNTYIIDHATKTIKITKDFAKRSGIIGSNEYHALVMFRRDFPDYEIRFRTAKVNKEKETYGGLTFEFMEKYLTSLNDPAALDGLKRVKEYYKGQPAYYAKVKKWFLSNYKDYETFNPALATPDKPAESDKPAKPVTSAEPTTPAA